MKNKQKMSKVKIENLSGKKSRRDEYCDNKYDLHPLTPFPGSKIY